MDVGMDDRTEPLYHYELVRWYAILVRYLLVWSIVSDFDTGFWSEIKLYGPWFLILVRNLVVRSVYGLLVCDFRTGAKWSFWKYT